MANKNDWISMLSAHARQAYRPTFGQTVLQPFGQAFSQGLIGKQIAQNELRKAIMTAMMEKNIPMVGEQPATVEQIMRGIQPPGLLERLLFRRQPVELTWQPRTTELEQRYKLMGTLREQESKIKEKLLEKEYALKTQLETLKAKEKSVKTEAELNKIRQQTGLLYERTEMMKYVRRLISPEATETPESRQKKLNFVERMLKFIGIGKEEENEVLPAGV